MPPTRRRTPPCHTSLPILIISLFWIISCTADAQSGFQLKILHLNDLHSHLDGTTMDLSFNGLETKCNVGGMARLASEIKKLQKENENHLLLHAGDAVQGTLYYTLFGGKADAQVMNAIGFHAMAIGNHEFDGGDAWLAGFIDQLETPVISANIDVTPGNVLERRYTPYVIVAVGGEKVGIIGLTIAGKTKQSSQPSDEITFKDEVMATQSAVKKLTSQGIGKIILLSHYGYDNVLALAPQVAEIDVIVDGDSHTLLGDFKTDDLESAGPYPTVVKNRDGDDVCVVQAWEYGKVLGDLDVVFLEDTIERCSGTPHLILGEPFTRKREEGESYSLEKNELNDLQATVMRDPKLSIVMEDPAVAAIIDTYAVKVDQLRKQIIGRAEKKLNHNRVPLHGSNGKGSLLGSAIAPVVAKAFYDQDPHADLSIQNAGGVRISIDEGAITYDTAYTLLPFSNTLFEIKMTGLEIKQVLEDALENIAQGGSTGSFPYGYGVKYDVDARQPFGSRISNLVIKDRGSGLYSHLMDDQIYVVVTNSYIASGRDGYTTFKRAQEKRGGTDTYLEDTMAFINYVKSLTLKGEAIKALPDADYCIKKYTSS